MANNDSSLKSIDMAYIAMFAALMAIGANITAMITIGTIPLTMQTFFAIMAGALLGSRLGALSMIVYTFIGLIGVPVFSGFTGGPGAVFLPTFGFVISFIFVAYIIGKIIETKTNPGFPRFSTACFIGLIVNYLIGTNIMYLAASTWIGLDWSYSATWMVMLPFLPKDLFFTAMASVVCPRIFKAVRKSSSYREANL